MSLLLPQLDQVEPVAEPRLQPVAPAGAEYRRSRAAFLANTDQRTRAWAHLDGIVDQLPARRSLLDVGAGEGSTTARLAARFGRTTAVEPDPRLHPALRRACPDATVIGAPLDQVVAGARADLVLCSHVLYQLPAAEHGPLVRRMLEWTAAGGELVVLLQNPGSDCMSLLRHFSGAHHDLAVLRDELLRTSGDLVAGTSIDTVPARVHVSDLEQALDVADFLLDLAPPDQPGARPDRGHVADYLTREFADTAGGFSLSCTLDFLRVRRAG